MSGEFAEIECYGNQFFHEVMCEVLEKAKKEARLTTTKKWLGVLASIVSIAEEISRAEASDNSERMLLIKSKEEYKELSKAVRNLRKHLCRPRKIKTQY